MKIISQALSCGSAVLTALLVTASASQLHANASILPDGTFEKFNAETGQAHGWPGGRSVSWGEEDGNRFMRIVTPGPARMEGLFMEVPVAAGVEALELSYRGRVTNLKRGAKPHNDARIIINFKDAAGKRIGSAKPSYHGKNTDGWESRTVRSLVPEAAVSLDFMPTLFHAESGTFDIDDVSLKPIDAKALKEEQARNAPPPVPVREFVKSAKWPAEIFVVGNRLQDAAGNEVWLQGVNIASLEWRPDGENVLHSFLVAIEKWNANAIRLPIKDTYWFGKDASQNDGGATYRDLVDAAITLATNRGAYVILDLHQYRAPRPEHIAFWKDAAARYANHPGVLFDLLNEPHGISWEVWRDGGFVEEKGKVDEDAFFATEEERLKNRRGFESPGMQKIVEVVRSTGARNVLVAGALDYAYDLSGIINGFALEDTEGGNGIMYASHIYPWKSGWQAKMLDVAEHYPILIGEVGAAKRKQPWEKPENFVPPETWVPDMLGMIQKYRLNWTAWCFHPQAGPRILEDWRYTPTSYWGDPVKRALSGEQFELKRMR